MIADRPRNLFIDLTALKDIHTRRLREIIVHRDIQLPSDMQPAVRTAAPFERCHSTVIFLTNTKRHFLSAQAVVRGIEINRAHVNRFLGIRILNLLQMFVFQHTIFGNGLCQKIL